MKTNPKKTKLKCSAGNADSTQIHINFVRSAKMCITVAKFAKLM
jgi:hypothetical protein